MKKNYLLSVLITSLAISFFHPPLLQADIILDEVMPKEEQKKTGVSHLSRKQKLALETWLNDTFVLKAEARKSESTPLYLSLNLQRGKQLQLSDNSIWEIDPLDVKISSGWLTPISIKFGSSKNPVYPYLLINTESGASVKAKLASPPPPKPKKPDPEKSSPSN